MGQGFEAGDGPKRAGDFARAGVWGKSYGKNEGQLQGQGGGVAFSAQFPSPDA